MHTVRQTERILTSTDVDRLKDRHTHTYTHTCACTQVVGAHTPVTLRDRKLYTGSSHSHRQTDRQTHTNLDPQ